MPRNQVPFFEDRAGIFARLYEYQEPGLRAPTVKLCSVKERDFDSSGKRRTKAQEEKFLRGCLIQATKRLIERKASAATNSATKTKYRWLKVVQLYLDSKAQDHKGATTQKGYAVATQHFYDAVGDIDIAEIKPLHGQKFISHLTSKNFVPQTINSYITHVKAVLNWAEENEIIERAPKFKKVREPEKKPSFYSMEAIHQMQRYLEDLIQNDDPRWKADRMMHLRAMWMMWGTGCRVGEAMYLPLERIDLKQGKIWIAPVTNARKEIIWTPKKGVERECPMAGSLIEFLQGDFSQREPKEKFYLDSGYGTPRYRAATTLAHAFKKYQLKLGIAGPTGRRPKANHGFRATTATLMLRGGVDSYVVMKTIGHKKQETTEHYMSEDDELRRKAINAVDQQYKAKSKTP